MARVNLERILKRKKLSKYRFAKMIGIDYKNTPRMFKPSFDPRVSSLIRWAKILKCKVRDLIEE